MHQELSRFDIESKLIPDFKVSVGSLINFDPGINRRRVFAGEKAFPVQIFNRSAFLAECDDYLIQNPNHRMTVLKFDIKNFRNADLVIDKQGNHAADYVLNQFAAELVKDGNGQTNQMRTFVGRYGGDEFVIAILGEYADEKLKAYEKVFREKYSIGANGKTHNNLKTFGARSSPQQLLLNDDKGDIFEEIKRPEKGIDQYIFDFFRKKNLLLRQSEITKIKDIYAGQDISKVLKSIDALRHRETSQTSRERLIFLSERYPELKVQIDRLLLFNLPDLILNEAVVFLEKRKLDNLLGDIVLAPDEFKDRVDNRNYDHLYCFDIKMMKEINEIRSYVEGDITIMSLWKKIKDLLGDHIDEVDIGRRGGAFYIGVKKGKNFRFKNIDIVQMQINTKDEFVVGYHDRDLNTENPRQSFIDLIENAEVNFYDQLIEFLSSDEHRTGDTIYQNINYVFPPNSFAKNRLVIDRLIESYFISKRVLNRTQKMLDRLNLDQYDKLKYHKLKEIMEIVKNSALELFNQDHDFSAAKLSSVLAQRYLSFK